ncbi:hypothetical protein IWQ61_000992 [Dispira simplex]|nr:hypothetical protein IWQ61_000992 [Dispira simplex]
MSNSKSTADPAVRERIQQVIRYQFDLEIHLKQHELAIIESELARGKRTLHELDEWLTKATPGNIETSATLTQRPQRKRPRPNYRELMSEPSTTNAHAQTDSLVVRLPDDSLVKMACPTCGRYKFTSLQGFLNHTRISHGVEFASHEEAVRLCGTPMDESGASVAQTPSRSIAVALQPNWLTAASDTPAEPTATPGLTANTLLSNQILSETQLSQLSSTLDYIKRKPGIKVFEEEVDLDSDHSDVGTPATPTKEFVSQRSLHKPAKSLREADGSNAGAQTDSPTRELTAEEEAARIDALLMPTHNKPLHGAEPTGLPSPPIVQLPVPFPHLQGRGITNFRDSRFYIAKRILVGNVSKYIPVAQRPNEYRDSNYKWMVYITTPRGNDHLSTFVEKIKVFLHPSYRPQDVVELTGPKFQLTRYGWGEFPLRLRLYFVDPRNKPIDIIHQLQLDKTHCGEQVPGHEQIIDLELDRNTRFIPSRKPIRHDNKSPGNTMDDLENYSLQSTDDDVPFESAVVTPIVDPSGVPWAALPWLWVASDWYPIVLGADARSRWESDYLKLPYSTASDETIFNTWSVGKRQAVEWRRARCIREFLQKLAWHPHMWKKRFNKYVVLHRGSHTDEMAKSTDQAESGQLAKTEEAAQKNTPSVADQPPSTQTKPIRTVKLRRTTAQRLLHAEIEEEQRLGLLDISTRTILRWCRTQGLTPIVPPPPPLVSHAEPDVDTKPVIPTTSIEWGPTAVASNPTWPPLLPSPVSLRVSKMGDADSVPDKSQCKQEDYCRICGLAMAPHFLLKHLQPGQRCDRWQRWLTNSMGNPISRCVSPSEVSPTEIYQNYAALLKSTTEIPLSLTSADDVLAHPLPYPTNSLGTAHLEGLFHGSLTPQELTGLRELLTLLDRFLNQPIRAGEQVVHVMNGLSMDAVLMFYSFLTPAKLCAFHRLYHVHHDLPSWLQANDRYDTTDNRDKFSIFKVDAPTVRFLPLVQYAGFMEWIWQTIRPLPIPRFIPLLLSTTNTDQPSSFAAQEETTSDADTLVHINAVGSLLAMTVRGFLKDLIRSAVKVCHAQHPDLDNPPITSSSQLNEQPVRMLVPMHVLAACCKDPQRFDFLTHRGLGMKHSNS